MATALALSVRSQAIWTPSPNGSRDPTFQRTNSKLFGRPVHHDSSRHLAFAKSPDPIARLFYLMSHCWNHATAGCSEPYFLGLASSSRSVAGGGARESAPISARNSGVMTIFTESSEACS
jgi:hypothetical protein